jgi:hypothetical protein
VRRRFQFNIIHPASGLKVDVIASPDTAFARSEASRSRRLVKQGQYAVWFGSPEDILLGKLLYYQLSGGESDKHLRDIGGIMKIQGEKLDRTYIQAWTAKLGLEAEWALVSGEGH